MAALTLSAPAMPTANAGVAGIPDGGNSTGSNSCTYKYANGSAGADTIANAQLLAPLPANSRLRELLAESYATVAAMNEAFAAAGLVVSYPVGTNTNSNLAFTNAAPGVPTATLTTTLAAPNVGLGFRLSISHSIGR